jgi:hypothetical protein
LEVKVHPVKELVGRYQQSLAAGYHHGAVVARTDWNNRRVTLALGANPIDKIQLTHLSPIKFFEFTQRKPSLLDNLA